MWDNLNNRFYEWRNWINLVILEASIFRCEKAKQKPRNSGYTKLTKKRRETFGLDLASSSVKSRESEMLRQILSPREERESARCLDRAIIVTANHCHCHYRQHRGVIPVLVTNLSSSCSIYRSVVVLVVSNMWRRVYFYDDITVAIICVPIA